MFSKTKSKNKKFFCKRGLQCLSNKNVLTGRKKKCLKISGEQAATLEGGFIELKSYFKQMPVPFKVYPGFECMLKSIKSNEGFYKEKYQDHIPCSFSYKLGCVSNKFIKPIVVYKGGNAAYRFI